MTDIEGRIRGHSNAFEGLLSLLPADKYFQSDAASQWNKRKQTREESKKAKKAKLDPDSSITAGEVLKRKRDDGERTEGGEQRTVNEKKAKKKRKQKPEEATSKTDNSQKKASKNQQKQKQNKPSHKSLTNGAPNAGTSDNSTDDEKDEVEPEAALIEVNGSFGTDTTSTESTSEETKTAEPAPAPRIELDPQARAEARARLAARIEALRANRKADGLDGSPVRNRQELMEARRKKEAARKERKRELRLAAKAEQSKAESQKKGVWSDVDMKDAEAPAAQQPANNFAFGKVMFNDGEQLDPSLQSFQKSRKRKGPTDAFAQMKQVEAKKVKLANMDAENAEKTQEKDMWNKALKQAQGEKVRDDEKLLKKALKRQEKTKKKSERAWKERIENVAKSKAVRQKKREENIAARKEQKKLGKKVNSAGKKKVQMKKKGGARPGFEGSMKSGSKTVGNKKGKK